MVAQMVNGYPAHMARITQIGLYISKHPAFFLIVAVSKVTLSAIEK